MEGGAVGLIPGVRKPFLTASVVLLVLLIAASTTTSDATNVVFTGALHGGFPGGASRACGGSIGECNDEETEWLMESGTGRRLLQQSKDYVTYKAIQQPQSTRPAKSGEPYKRGCSTINKCRGSGSY